jgi:hypothetical protein
LVPHKFINSLLYSYQTQKGFLGQYWVPELKTMCEMPHKMNQSLLI